MKVPSRPVLVFLLVFCAALTFALYTRHEWEDCWITFCTSRNFAEGHGLVYSRSDRLHTLTSPVGVLLHAPCELFTEVPPDAQEVRLRFGYSADAYLHDDNRQKTGGMRFSAHRPDQTGDYLIWTRELKPFTEPSDRGLQSTTFRLPAEPRPARMIFRIGASETKPRDWTVWARPEFC